MGCGSGPFSVPSEDRTSTTWLHLRSTVLQQSVHCDELKLRTSRTVSGTERAKLCWIGLQPWDPIRRLRSKWKVIVYSTSEMYPSGTRWFAVWTRSRQEKSAAAQLETLQIPHYLPLKRETRQWSDRKQSVKVPLFSGYLFVRINPSQESRLQVLKTPGVVRLVGNSSGPAPIPEEQVDQIRTVVN